MARDKAFIAARANVAKPEREDIERVQLSKDSQGQWVAAFTYRLKDTDNNPLPGNDGVPRPRTVDGAVIENALDKTQREILDELVPKIEELEGIKSGDPSEESKR